MADDLTRLVEVLQPERLDTNLFRGETWPPRKRRVFGGQVLAQAMNAAICTIEPDRRVHSLHAYFLRAGNPDQPIIYDVDPIRDGRSFSTRRVVAIQDGRAIFNTSMSFQVAEEGPEHQTPMPDVPPPEEIENNDDYFQRLRKAEGGEVKQWERPVDYRSIDKFDPRKPQKREPHMGLWMRANGTLPDDPGAHETLLAYMSDSHLMGTALLPHDLRFGMPNLLTASLDHGLWYHDSFRADEWLYYDMSSARSSRSRGINYGSVYTRDGRLVATAIQEGLARLYK